VAKKKKPKTHAPTGEADDVPVAPKVPERIASPFLSALAPLKKELAEREKAAKEAAKAPKPPPPPHKRTKSALSSPGFSEDDSTALSLAMHGVKPLDDGKALRVGGAPRTPSRTAKVAPFGRGAEHEARARLDALVAQEVRFRIQQDESFLWGVRIDAHERTARELHRRTRAAETLDLHGRTAREARDDITGFVRKAHRRGLDVLCIVHGKGQHSEGGKGVLRDAVLSALTETGAAPLVLAFVTAPDVLGGSGALLVELKH
jgi:DNA-nicking Smr family endonuclease